MTGGERLADPDDPESYPRAVWLDLKSHLKEPRELCLEHSKVYKVTAGWRQADKLSYLLQKFWLVAYFSKTLARVSTERGMRRTILYILHPP